MSRKTYTNRKGDSFRVGTIVVPFGGAVSGQRGIILKILPPYGDGNLGYRCWVAFDVPTKYRRFDVAHPSKEGRWDSSIAAQRASKERGSVTVSYYLLDHLNPVGQASRVPKVSLSQKPNALHTEVRGTWVGTRATGRRR